MICRILVYRYIVVYWSIVESFFYTGDTMSVSGAET